MGKLEDDAALNLNDSHQKTHEEFIILSGIFMEIEVKSSGSRYIARRLDSQAPFPGPGRVAST
jgi:hypothetical protein